MINLLKCPSNKPCMHKKDTPLTKGGCDILNEVYPDGECPWQKERADEKTTVKAVMSAYQKVQNMELKTWSSSSRDAPLYREYDKVMQKLRKVYLKERGAI